MWVTLLATVVLGQEPGGGDPSTADPSTVAAEAEPAPLPSDPAELRAEVRRLLVADGVSPDALDGAVEEVARSIEFERRLTPQGGAIALGDGLATLDLGERFVFLGSEQTGDVLEAWGNPRPNPLPLGMVLPAGMSPLDGSAWAVIVQYEAEGHVDDSDAASIDYDELLASMQESTKESAKARVAAGYEPLELVGWAAPPRYDAAERKLYWAKHLRAPTSETLNYDIRVLGRRGVLSLQAVAGMDDLAVVQAGMTELMPLVTFNEGERYADFDPDIDTVAAYGIGALVAGKVAAKAGFFKGALAMLLAGKKGILAVVALVVGLGAKLLGKKPAEPTET